jgi:hypothetical protein
MDLCGGLSAIALKIIDGLDAVYLIYLRKST